MTVKNNLKEILEDHGIQKISPSKELLNELKMSSIRFFQIYENRGKRVINAEEIQNLDNWLKKSFKGVKRDLVSPVLEKAPNA